MYLMVAEIKIQPYNDEKKDLFVCKDFERLINRNIKEVLLYKDSLVKWLI